MSTNNNIVSWPEEPLHERFRRCRALLRIHGMLSEMEDQKVTDRIKKSSRRRQEALDALDRLPDSAGESRG